MKDKKKLVSIIILILGIITLVVGVVFLVIRLNSIPAVSDAEYLTEIGTWEREPSVCPESEPQRDDCGMSGVIWTFTEIGKGTLTTNNHINDYNFTWAIEDDRLKIKTDWLYEMNDEYEYELDQQSDKLTLNDSIVFTPAN